MAAAPLITVVVPAFDAGRTIRATIESILAQTYHPIELLVVDDGSRDDTPAVLAGFGDSIRVIRQENAGDAQARNRGIREARGAYVGFCDADDLWRPTKLAVQIEALERDPSIGAAQCAAIFVDDELRPLEVRRCGPGLISLWDVLCFRDLPALSSAVVARKTCLERIGLIDPSVRGKDEWDLAIKLARFCRLMSIPDALVLRRVHATSMTQQAAYTERQIAAGSTILARLFGDPALEKGIRARRRLAYAAFYRMIAGSYFGVGEVRRSIAWMLRAIASDPTQLGYVLALPFRRRAKARSRSTPDADQAGR